MKQVIQIYKTGKLDVLDVPTPQVRPSSVLVRTLYSAISTGTEKTKVDTARMSLIQKARSRPDLVKKVIEKVRKEGLLSTYQMVEKKLSDPMPMGYSCVGIIEEIGDWVEGFRVGDRVACAGAGSANHAELNVVPARLVAHCPDTVPLEQAAFTTIGSIALQGVRQADPKLGERIVVIGMGLIGQIACQLLKANGCEVFAVDLDPWKLAHATKCGSINGSALAFEPGISERVLEWSRGRGADAVILTASTASNQPITQAGAFCRDKGRVVIVGAVGTEFPREPFYMKELDIRIARSYGPGRYDPQYEEIGIDYPLGFVRFTEQRNMETFLDLLGSKQIDLSHLITHRFKIGQAADAFQLISGESNQGGAYLGILLSYESDQAGQTSLSAPKYEAQIDSENSLNLGFIGLGNYATAQLLPQLSRLPGIQLKEVVTGSGVSAAAKAKQFGFQSVREKATSVLASPNVGTVFVVTRHDSHASFVKEALIQGKNVFVEKPLCLRLDELREIQEAYQISKGILCVGFNRRFSPLITELKSHFPKGATHILYRINAGALPAEHWLKIPEIGGGRLIGEGCHFVDLASFLAESPIQSVYASQTSTAGSLKSPIASEDVHILIGFRNGSSASILYTSCGNSKLPKEYLEVHGGGLSAILSDFISLEVLGRDKKIQGRQNKGQSTMLKEFIQACASGDRSRSPIPPQEIWNSTLATFAIIESLRTGCQVRLDSLSAS